MFKRIITALTVSLLVTGCASDKHLLFFTNSSIGVDVSVEQSTSPVKFIVGYKRQEGVIDPLTQQAKAGDPQSPLSEAHSVIAKMNFGSTGGAPTSSAAQWFATGKAAEYLAQNPAISGAITGDAKMITTRGLNTKQERILPALTTINSVYSQFSNYVEATPSDREAVRLKSALDSIDNGRFREKAAKIHVVAEKLVVEDHETTGPPSFTKAINFVRVQEASIENGNKAAAKDSGIKSSASGNPLSEDERAALKALITKTSELTTALKNELGNAPEIPQLFDFYTKKILFSSHELEVAKD